MALVLDCQLTAALRIRNTVALNEPFAERRDTKVTLLQLMLIPSVAAGVVLFASVIVQRVRREW